MILADFDTTKYEDGKNKNGALKQKYSEMLNEIEDLVGEFDLTGDRLLSPEEFYNVLMAYYDWKFKPKLVLIFI